VSDDEGAGEKIVEAGLELVNPGGDPDALRAAATAWRTMGRELDQAFSALDRRVKSVLGEHWRGDSADACKAHWDELHREVVSAHSTFADAARGLDEAADNIEQVNHEIHGIYIEIGVSIGIGVGLSFVTMGFGGAAAAANATRLAAQAARVATRLGTILRRIATLFRTIVQTAQRHRFLTNVAINWAGGVGGDMAGKAYSGKGVTGADLWDSTWQGGVSAVAGTGVGMTAGAKLGEAATELSFVRNLGNLPKNMISGSTEGIVGGVSGGAVVDGIGIATGDTSRKEAGFNIGANFAGGALGGVASAGAGHLNNPTDGLVAPDGFTPGPERAGPSFAVEAPLGGVTSGLVAAGKETISDDDSGGDESSRVNHSSAQERSANQNRDIRDVFG
jgi:WXG100 family type VII secretion target